MHTKKIFISAVVLVLVMLLGVTSCSPGDIKAFEGILKQVDGLSGNVTVTMKDGTTVNFNLADIELNTGDGGISLEPGDNVTVEKDKVGKVKRVKICYAEIQGTIKSIAGDNVTITTEKKGDITLLVTPKTVIIMSARNFASFAELAVGQRVTAKYETKTSQAVKIIVHQEKTEAEIQGTIKSIVADNVTITTNKNGDITLVVTPETRILTTDNNNNTLAGLAVGQKVTAKYEIATNKAIKIIVHAEKPVIKYTEILGTIKNITGDNVTITTLKKGDITVLVANSTKIFVGASSNATISDLAVGQSVSVKYETATMIAVKIIVKIEKKVIKYDEILGTIKNITGDNVTVATLKKGDITVLVTSSTKIIVGANNNATIADLAVGQSVSAKYETGTMAAVKIIVKIEKVIKDIQGTILAIGSDNQTVTIAIDDAESVILNITPETVIKIVDVGVGSVADLGVGQKVEVKYYADTMNAVKIYIYIEEV
jgi:hypothetical protein